MDYTFLKHIHISCAAASGAFFVVRAAWMWRASPMLGARWVRTAPHVIDTLLLASAVTLAWMGGLSPLQQPWLAAKIGALLLYIVLGTLALKRGKTIATRRSAALGAIAVFAYIVAVAISKQPLVFS